MLKLSCIILSFVALTACSSNSSHRSDLVADTNSFVNKINLLKDDKKLGIKRHLNKVTEETVDTDNNIHKKTVKINETLEMKGVKGDAKAVLVFDSAKQQRSGNRSIVLNDDGTASLGNFVKQFETSRYKYVPNDAFANSQNDTQTQESNNIVSDNGSPVFTQPLGVIPQRDLQNTVGKQEIITDKPLTDNIKLMGTTQPLKRGSLMNNMVNDKMINQKNISNPTIPDKLPMTIKPAITMKPVATKEVEQKSNIVSYTDIIKPEGLGISSKKNGIINSVSLKPLTTKENKSVTSKPTPIHVWL